MNWKFGIVLCLIALLANKGHPQTVNDARAYYNHQFTCGIDNSDSQGYWDIRGVFHQNNPQGHINYLQAGRECDFVPTWTYRGTPYHWSGQEFDTPAMVRMNLLTYRDLFAWLNDPFQTPISNPDPIQLGLNLP